MLYNKGRVSIQASALALSTRRHSSYVLINMILGAVDSKEV